MPRALALVRRRELEIEELEEAFRLMPIEWSDAHVYQSHREEAVRRMEARDPDD